MATSTHSVERRFTPDRRAGSTVNSNRMTAVDWVAMTLLIIGGINWGLVGLFGFDLVATLFGAMSPVSRVIYSLVGLSALYSIYTCIKVSSHKKLARGSA